MNPTVRRLMLPMIIHSNGWDIQSWTIHNMVIFGELPPFDATIFADTGHEASWTYDFARRWTPYLEKHDINVVTVRDENVRIVTDRQGGKSSFPPSRRATQKRAGSCAVSVPTAGRSSPFAAGYKRTA